MAPQYQQQQSQCPPQAAHGSQVPLRLTLAKRPLLTPAAASASIAPAAGISRISPLALPGVNLAKTSPSPQQQRPKRQYPRPGRRSQRHCLHQQLCANVDGSGYGECEGSGNWGNQVRPFWSNSIDNPRSLYQEALITGWSFSSALNFTVSAISSSSDSFNPFITPSRSPSLSS